jgi:hypothetical protein
MKKSVILISAFVVLVSFTTNSAWEDVLLSLKSGNSSRISLFFDERVELSFPESNHAYSKTQAEAVVRDFFQLHQVRNFELLHKGENVGSFYCIGTLHTKNGVFRTTVFVKQKGNKQLVQEIRFEIK